MQWNSYWTVFCTCAAQCGSVWKVACYIVTFEQWSQYSTHWTWIYRAITVTRNVTVYRADIHTCTTTDTTKHFLECTTQDTGTTVVDDDDMSFFRAISFTSATRTSHHGEVVGNFSTYCRAVQHFHHNVKSFEVRNDTFCTQEDYLSLRNGTSHTTVTFVGNDCASTGCSNCKVTTINAYVSFQETFTYITTYEVSHFSRVFSTCIA